MNPSEKRAFRKLAELQGVALRRARDAEEALDHAMRQRDGWIDYAKHLEDSGGVRCKCGAELKSFVVLGRHLDKSHHMKSHHMKHPAADYCVFCREQWPCEDSRAE